MSQSNFETGRHTSAKLPIRPVTEWAMRRPILALTLCLLAAAACIIYAATGLAFKTKRADLIDPSADYHRRWINYTNAFGDHSDMVVVVEAKSPNDASAPDLIKQVIDDLGRQLELDQEHFSNVLYRTDADNPKLRAKGLQYLDVDKLEELDRSLRELNQVLKGRWALFNVASIFQGLQRKIEQVQKSPEEQQPKLLEKIYQQAQGFAESLNRYAAKPQSYYSPWQGLTSFGSDLPTDKHQEIHLMTPDGTMGFLKVRPIVDENDFSGASDSIRRLRELLKPLSDRYPDVTIGLTGIPVLEYDEMQQSQQAMFWASGISFLGVGVLLIIGFRGIRHPMMALSMLAVAMAWSMGIATGLIGHLNILSVSFFAILIGLGIDFAIHFLARYLELRHQGEPLDESLLDTSTSVGPGIVTAGITTSLAFYCAALTDFLGVAELGIIAGSGILLCVAAAFLMLPALVSLADHNMEPRQLPIPFQGKALKRLTARHPVLVVTLSLIATGYIGVHGLQVKYDDNLLNLQAEDLESVQVQDRVFKKANGSLLYAVSVADSPAEARSLAQKFKKLDCVDRVAELASSLPHHNPDDVALHIQSINVWLENLPPPKSTLAELAGDLYKVEPEKVGLRVEELWDMTREADSPTAQAAAASMDRFLDRFEELTLQEQINLIGAYEQRMAGDLISKLYQLRAVANPEPISIKDFPENVRSRMVSEDGKWLIQIYPAFEIWDHEPLKRFVAAIREVDPNVTGTPLQNYEASRQIAKSYQRVAIYALITVFVVLLIDLQSIKDALFALLPPLAGGILMMGVLGMMGVDLNPANLIVLPLVIGIGVDDGVHVVHDFRHQTSNYRMSASTTNAIVLTSLTSMIGFGSMMIASHRGLYSLGLVLVIGVGACLFVSLVMLPALLTLFSNEIRKSHPWTFTDDGRVITSQSNAEPTPPEEILPLPKTSFDFEMDDESDRSS